MSRFTGARLINELSRSRTSSPRNDDFETAHSASLSNFDLDADGAINSTAALDNHTAQQHLPIHYDQFAEPYEAGSDGSTEMSIEHGRGAKRGTHQDDQDRSSSFRFSMGNDSQYELTGTPPIRPKTSQRKSDGTLRREASVRQANEAAKANNTARRATSSTKQRSLSETLAKLNAESDHSLDAGDTVNVTAVSHPRKVSGSRFRQVSGNEATFPTSTRSGAQQTPRRTTIGTATVQSATYTAQSFMLPDMPNITELVSGRRTDGTPIFERSTKSRSRFASASYQPKPDYANVESMPVPEEEKRIFASLQLLQDKVSQLELEKAEASKRAEEYEGEIIELRSRVDTEQRLRRPDSALGSDEEGATDKLRKEKTRLQASVKALQDRLDRSERKISVSEIAVKRVTKERDQLVTQLGVAYYNVEELKAENETFRDSHARLQDDNTDLKSELAAVKQANVEMRVLISDAAAQHNEQAVERGRSEQALKSKPDKRKEAVREVAGMPKDVADVKESAVRSRKEGRDSQHEKRKTQDVLDEEARDRIAFSIEEEMRRCREEAAARVARDRASKQASQPERVQFIRSRSKSQQHQQSAGAERRSHDTERSASLQVESDVSDAESTTELDITQKTRNTVKEKCNPSPAKAKAPVATEEDQRDLTYLSFMDEQEIANLRKKLEQERRQGRLGGRTASAPVATQNEPIARSAAGAMPRKSSLKDTANGFDTVTGRFSIGEEDAEKVAKTVRVQSPHTSDGAQQEQTELGDISMLSNTSRRRRSRVDSMEGMTSAFIIPDITLHSTQQLASNGKSIVQHKPNNCTTCPPGEDIIIPTPVPVTDRDLDVTDATIRPAQPPPLALATVLKQLEDEVTHLKIHLSEQQRLYNQHIPALLKRQRRNVKAAMDRLEAEIEKRSDQIYALYDVVEGQKQQAAWEAKAGDDGKKPDEMDEEEVEETLVSIGIDPVEMAGRIGRKPPTGLDGADDLSESEELPWAGLSDYESGEEIVGRGAGREKRRSVGV